ncbi:unnamed protein product [Caenorhabditis sp. 36 PRJEB53466]|nr:unnamed protein product [Caenorhabditis sp. 36 PRJEB53466]
MNSLFFFFLFLTVFCSETHAAEATLTAGAATKQSPGITLKASVDSSGRLLQTTTWTVQIAQCEVISRTDDSITSRATLVSLTSTCIHRNVCQVRGPIVTPIACDDFLKRLNA